MKNAKYKITVDEISEAQIQANLGLIRPTPTSFDNKTVVTAESILGSIQNDILTAKNLMVVIVFGMVRLLMVLETKQYK